MELLESRKLMTSVPYHATMNGEGESCPGCGGGGCNCSGATASDTGEFMLGRIAVTPILMESTGAASIYDWTPQQKADVLANLRDGLDWWKQLLATKSSVHTLDWVIDTTYLDSPVATSYEPIKQTSNQYVNWVPDFLNFAGHNQASDIDTNIRRFNDSQRTKLNTDWSFSIFVVNSDSDDLFAAGGSFSRAFAFAGGLYFVTPSNRPASTYAHETGHMFWARDEYPGGGNYQQRRGYYDAQNLNAVDLNPTPNFQQQTSIMSAGTSLDTAYNTVVTSQATLAQIGWQDSDADGIFDVLDVPLELNGVGRLDTTSNEYRFDGTARAKALPNRNSSGFQSDITLNKVGRIEYRLNNATTWTTAASPNTHQTDLSLRIPIPSGTTGTIEIRAIDPRIGITSEIFTGSLAGFDATTSSGLNGFVWSDSTNDGLRQLLEPGLAGWTVQVVDGTGSLVDFQTKVEPDLSPLGILPTNAYSGVTLRAVGKLADGTLSVATDSRATTGTKVFVPVEPFSTNELSGWQDDDQNLEARFTSLQSAVSVDVFGLGANSYARLEAYSASGQLLERLTSSALANGQSTKLVLNRTMADIQYVVIKGHLSTRIGIDNLRFGAANQTVTGAFGEYKLLGLAPGTYQLKAVPPTGFVPTSPSSGTTATSVVLGQATTHVDFGFFWTGSPWQNPRLNVDVNNDGVVSPLDALNVINALSRFATTDNLVGSPVPTTPYVDVNGDGSLSPIDVLVVINYLARQNRSATGEAGPTLPTHSINIQEANEPGDGEPGPFPVASVFHPFSRRRYLSSNSAIDPTSADVDLVMSQFRST
jgi:Dockerin type I domain